MNFNIKIFLLCPVPEDQKPINEYINIKENALMNWTMSSLKKYIFRIISGYFIMFPTFLICFLNLTPFSLIEIIKVFLISSTFFFTSIYFRWFEVNKRLTQSRVFYEEASWFDGKIWEKPFFLIKNDKLLSSQKIQPILKRLFGTILINLSIFSVITILAR
jgi:hypothetical protein|tara:strand:+ start:2566 stop:3048 length:483 start_codon:yes stop_codon:yes gene_type:complete